MKARKTMRTLPLIQEVMSQISSRFAPKTSDIKKVCYLLLSSLRAQNNWYCSGRRRLIFSWIKSTSSESTTGGTRSPTPPRRCPLPPFFSCFNLLCYLAFRPGSRILVVIYWSWYTIVSCFGPQTLRSPYPEQSSQRVFYSPQKSEFIPENGIFGRLRGYGVEHRTRIKVVASHPSAS